MNQENNEINTEEKSSETFLIDDKMSKLLPSSGFDFAFSKFQETLDTAKKALNIKIDDRQDSTTDFLSIEDLMGESKRNNEKKLRSRIEAILFLSDKPRTAESIAQQCEADTDLVKQALSQLVQDYEDRDGGIVIDCTHGYCMQIADEFEDLTEDILPIELRTAVLRTLSTIALKEPMLQSDLMQIRGGGIYEHVKELVELGLVKKSKEGNSHVLHTTKFFSENFKLSQNGLELQTILKKASPTDVEFVRPNTLIASQQEESEEIQEADAQQDNNEALI